MCDNKNVIYTHPEYPNDIYIEQNKDSNGTIEYRVFIRSPWERGVVPYAKSTYYTTEEQINLDTIITELQTLVPVTVWEVENNSNYSLGSLRLDKKGHQVYITRNDYTFLEQKQENDKYFLCTSLTGRGFAFTFSYDSFLFYHARYRKEKKPERIKKWIRDIECKKQEIERLQALIDNYDA